MTSKAELARKATPEGIISGMCRTAAAAAQRGSLKAAAGFHASCHGRWHTKPGETSKACVCPCHRPTDVGLADQLTAARTARQKAAGVDLSAKPPKVPRTHCRNEHEMTSENTGPKGDCRKCKRISSAKSKKRKKEQVHA